jgi:ribosomal protein S18 acetylase RimI-like enzyme
MLATHPVGIYPPAIRPVDVRRDLPAIADLIEICFASSLDAGGRGYLQQLRHLHHQWLLMQLLGQLQNLLQWHQGFVCVDANRLIGNISLQPSPNYRDDWVLANVAVHPDYRRQGIGKQLIQAALTWLEAQSAQMVSLQVDAENISALHLYQQQGFEFRVCHTTWEKSTAKLPKWLYGKTPLRPTQAREWPHYYRLAQATRPAGLTWYNPLRSQDFQVGFWQQLMHWMNADEQQRWVYPSSTGEQMLAMLHIHPNADVEPHLQILVEPAVEVELLPLLLTFGLRHLGHQRVVRLDYPTTSPEAATSQIFRDFGFSPVRHLRWGRKALGCG